MSIPKDLTSPPPTVPNTIVSFPSEHILLVTLNRPKQLNAIPTTSHPLFDRLWRWYDSQPSLRCAILTGTGRAFCAGADLKEWNHRNADDTSTSTTTQKPQEEDESRSQGRRDKWASAGFGGLSNRGGKKPVIAAVNGLCLGGGMEIALNCDLILASEEAVFGLPEVKRGVIALAGALPRLIRTVGKQRASEMALVGRHYPASVMYEWGIVNHIVPSSSSSSSSSSSKGNTTTGKKGEEEKGGVAGGGGVGGGGVVAEALRWAEEIAGNSPDSVIASREGLSLGWEPMGPQVSTEVLERGMYGRMEAGTNMVEGVLSFVEKRKPKWENSKL